MSNRDWIIFGAIGLGGYLLLRGKKKTVSPEVAARTAAAGSTAGATLGQGLTDYAVGTDLAHVAQETGYDPSKGYLDTGELGNILGGTGGLGGLGSINLLPGDQISPSARQDADANGGIY
jgi:hypothetical protein